MEKVKVFHVGNKKGLRKLIKLLDEQGVQHTLTKKTKVSKHYGIEYTIKNGVIALIEHAKVIELMQAAKKAAQYITFKNIIKMAKKNGKGNVKVAQNNNNGGNNADAAVEAAAMLTTTGGSSMDRNHQVDLLKMAHDRFFLDEKAAEHTGFPQGTIDKLNHINALGIAVCVCNEVKYGTSDFAVVIRKSALPELTEALNEIGVNFDGTKLLPSKDDPEAVEVTAKAVTVSEETSKKLEEDAKARAATAGKVFDPTKIKDEEELKEALSGFLAMNRDSKLMDSIMQCVNFYKSYRSIEAKRAIDSAEKTLKNTKDKKYKENAEKALASARNDMEHLKNMNFHDTFRKIVELTGRVGTLTYGIGAHFFNVTATSGSPVSAFCELRDHSTDKNTGVCKYTDDQIADAVKCLVIIGADDVRSKGKTLLKAENALPEKDRVKEHIDAANKNIAFADKATAAVLAAPGEFVENLKKNFLEGNNFAKKTVIAIKRAYYRDVTPDMMAKVKSDSMLDNATQYAGIISNLFRNPSDPLVGYAKENIIDLEFKTDEEIKAEEEAVAKAAKEAAEKKAAEDKKKEAKGKAKAQVKK